tara:strand:- start:224 stop:655 length:432 start_codon:yes stop_codon:yes gene_type:complete
MCVLLADYPYNIACLDTAVKVYNVKKMSRLTDDLKSGEFKVGHRSWPVKLIVFSVRSVMDRLDPAHSDGPWLAVLDHHADSTMKLRVVALASESQQRTDKAFIVFLVDFSIYHYVSPSVLQQTQPLILYGCASLSVLMERPML